MELVRFNIEYDDKNRWHLVDWYLPDPWTFCDGRYFWIWQSEIEEEWKDYFLKITKKWWITCNKCIDRINYIKWIRL